MLFLDCSISGASGDMLVASLISLGAEEDYVRSQIESSIPNTFQYEIEFPEIERWHVRGRMFVFRGEKVRMDIDDAMKLLEKTDPDVRKLSSRILRLLGSIEAEVHGKPILDDALDTLADIVGFCAALVNLGESEVYCSPLAIGMGFDETPHGKLPVPAPATARIISRLGIPIVHGPIRGELLTPTAASLLSIARYDPALVFYPRRIGCGFGHKELGIPNMVLAYLGERVEEVEEISVLESTVDKATPEQIGYVIERLLEEGALDAYVRQIVMKKSRPAHEVVVIARRSDVARFADLLMRELGTLGVRFRPSQHRIVVERFSKRSRLKIGGIEQEFSYKVFRDLSGRVYVSPEYEDARRISKISNLPLRDVMRLMEERAKRDLEEEERRK